MLFGLFEMFVEARTTSGISKQNNVIASNTFLSFSILSCLSSGSPHPISRINHQRGFFCLLLLIFVAAVVVFVVLLNLLFEVETVLFGGVSGIVLTFTFILRTSKRERGFVVVFAAKMYTQRTSTINTLSCYTRKWGSEERVAPILELC